MTNTCDQVLTPAGSWWDYWLLTPDLVGQGADKKIGLENLGI